MDLMVDLETFGLGTSPAIVQIGAVMFDPKTFNISTRTFNMNISLQSSIFNGGTVDKETLDWWKNTAPAGAREDISHSAVTIRYALEAFVSYFNSNKPDYIWANGAGDDIPWLRSAFLNAGINIPFRHYQVQDTRTIYRLAKDCGWERPQVETAHTGLADCIQQVMDLRSAMQFIAGNIGSIRIPEGDSSRRPWHEPLPASDGWVPVPEGAEKDNIPDATRSLGDVQVRNRYTGAVTRGVPKDFSWDVIDYWRPAL